MQEDRTITSACWLSNTLILIAVSPRIPSNSALLCLFDLSRLRTEDVHQRLCLESDRSLRVLDIRQQDSLVCCLASSQDSDPLRDFETLFVLRLDPAGSLFPHRSRAAKSLRLLHSIALPRGSSPPRAFLPIPAAPPLASPVEFGVEKDEEDDQEESEMGGKQLPGHNEVSPPSASDSPSPPSASLDVEQIVLVLRDRSADLVDLRPLRRRPLCTDLLCLFALFAAPSAPSASSAPPFARHALLFFASHRLHVSAPPLPHRQAWFPALDRSPPVYRAWIGPRQHPFRALPLGLQPSAWAAVALSNTFFLHRNRGELLLDVACVASAPVLALVERFSWQVPAFLRALLAAKPPALSQALEFCVHAALNHGSASCLHATLAALSALSFFPQILIRCLRKQERTTWPRALHSANDLVFVFRTFLAAGDLDFATVVISVLQGIACPASETSIPADNDALLYSWCNYLAVTRQTPSHLRFLLPSFAFVWNAEGSHGFECVAHKAGVELLLLRVLRGEVFALGDVYRFVLMEEQRHFEDHHPIASRFAIDSILTHLCCLLLSRGYIQLFADIQYAVGDVWKPAEKEFLRCPVSNFDEVLRSCFDHVDLEMPAVNVVAPSANVAEQIERCSDLGKA